MLITQADISFPNIFVDNLNACLAVKTTRNAMHKHLMRGNIRIQSVLMFPEAELKLLC